MWNENIHLDFGIFGMKAGFTDSGPKFGVFFIQQNLMIKRVYQKSSESKSFSQISFCSILSLDIKLIIQTLHGFLRWLTVTYILYIIYMKIFDSSIVNQKYILFKFQ